MREAFTDTVRNVLGAPEEHGLRKMTCVTAKRLTAEALTAVANAPEDFSGLFGRAIREAFASLDSRQVEEELSS